ncbi:hypothetical protein L7F22_006982 [Adiantum nelumboides]|nr:hypothetical protein [Adiantum nelumboides]
MESLKSYHFDLPADDPPDPDFDGGIDDKISLLQSSKKRKKVQLKKVVHVPITAGDASRDSSKGLTPPTDFWAWRKYGQKPIKGSPYPRGYYRCSSSKGCSARKQVERSRRDPSMLIVTYTADHNHVNTGKASAYSASSSKDHDYIHAVGATVTKNEDELHEELNLSSSAKTHFNQGQISANLTGDSSSASHNNNIELPTFHNPTTINNFPCNLASSQVSCDHQHYSLEGDHQQQVVAPPYYNWGPVKEECIAGEWQEDEYYYIIDEKKDNMSLCLSRCEEDDLFSELGMLPELASIFNNNRESINNGDAREGADEVRSIGLDHEHAVIFSSTATAWSNPPCPLA